MHPNLQVRVHPIDGDRLIREAYRHPPPGASSIEQKLYLQTPVGRAEVVRDEEVCIGQAVIVDVPTRGEKIPQLYTRDRVRVVSLIEGIPDPKLPDPPEPNEQAGYRDPGFKLPELQPGDSGEVTLFDVTQQIGEWETRLLEAVIREHAACVVRIRRFSHKEGYVELVNAVGQRLASLERTFADDKVSWHIEHYSEEKP
jgi:hypothetical protein